ncbi:hypothetical protein AMPC_28890 [Anaeromyxobacter paludicola]|uniref:Uncharacterized protein n=1 Tax=Anaeromyxobacter paludicola TaxID=2918171 RepID=A0ABM7XD24_9BACT|nr:hypothetical protein AMPC_28890 [Anaeromyxobacter paludicola]
MPLHEHFASWNDVVVGVMLLFIPVTERLLGSGARVAA